VPTQVDGGDTIGPLAAATDRARATDAAMVPGGAAPPPVATPAQIFGDRYLLDLDSRFVTQADGLVSAMLDQGPSGNDCTASGAQQPGYDPTGGVNGLPRLTLDGSQWLESGANVTGLSPGDPRTVYAVVGMTDNVLNAVFSNRLTGPLASYLAGAASPSFVFTDAVLVAYTQSGIPDTGVHVVEWQFTYASPTGLQVLVDGAPIGPPIDTSSATPDSGQTGYAAFNDPPSNLLSRGDGYRIIVVAGIPSPTEDAEMISYFQSVGYIP
jgi:hypothetical protein